MSKLVDYPAIIVRLRASLTIVAVTVFLSLAPRAEAVNYASYGGQSVPSTLSPNQRTTVSVTMLNSGDTTWVFGGSQEYKLGSWDPQDNFTWGTKKSLKNG